MRQENLKNNRDILLETRNLSVEFPLKKKSFFEKQKMLSAVSDVSIQIRKGETFGLVGESGCGKSTFANATLGFVKPRSGEIYFNGQPLYAEKKAVQEARLHMQKIFQDPASSLNPRFTVREAVCIAQIVRMTAAAQAIAQQKNAGLEEYNKKLEELCKKFQSVTKNAWLLESGNVNGSLSEMAMEYMRMLTHVDLMKFNSMVRHIGNCQAEVYELFDTLGLLEACISVASYRQMLPYWSKPQLLTGSRRKLVIEEGYHPLIEKPVANSMHTEKNVLLTGSNASGKSTFLRTIAVNAVLSQTIFTSVSKNYQAPYFRIYSSMSLKDDLGGKNSYYIVEIKALKRILTAAEQTGCPVLCFVDEVLRGTNTVERIAASSEILKYLKDKNVLCFAATHDIELTAILSGCYDNYHFQEEVTDSDVSFNFKLFKGPATTRNAIKLLKMIGYDASIIKGAECQAGYFIENGVK